MGKIDNAEYAQLLQKRLDAFEEGGAVEWLVKLWKMSKRPLTSFEQEILADVEALLPKPEQEGG